MTADEAIEILGGLVSQAGGEGDEALDVMKDTVALLNEVRDPSRTLLWPIGRHLRWSTEVTQVLGPR